MKEALCWLLFPSKALPDSQTAELGSFHFLLEGSRAAIRFSLSKDYTAKAALILFYPIC